MARSQVRRAVVGDPDARLGVLPDQDFERQIQGAQGEASISGVPALGLPKISSLVGRMRRPAFAASPL